MKKGALQSKKREHLICISASTFGKQSIVQTALVFSFFFFFGREKDIPKDVEAIRNVATCLLP